MPLGIVVGNVLGWRSSFALSGAVALALVGAVLVALPPLPAQAVEPGRAAGARATGGRGGPGVLVGLAAVTFLVSAHFVAYTYIRAILERDAGFGPTAVAASLLAYGALGLVGNFAGGALAARRSRQTVAGIGAGILMSVSLLAVGGSAAMVAGASILLWGLTYGGLSVSGQIWLTRSAPDRAEQVTGQYVGTFNASVALGSFVGGVVLEAAGTTGLLWSAAGLAAVALAILPWSPNPPRDRPRAARTAERR